MNFWQQLQQELENDRAVVLMYVLDSLGSSPGRQGFKMFVSASGLLHGSIGGGMMEFKLVEYCKSGLLQKPFAPFIKKQIHQTNILRDKSGMICSGQQTIAFYRLDAAQLPLIRQLNSNLWSKINGQLTLNQQGIFFSPDADCFEKYSFCIENDNTWLLTETLGWKPKLYIVGAGHVSLALCRMAAQLDFDLNVLDERPGLNTAPPADLAVYTQLPDYHQVGQYLPEGENSYVVLMSFGYRTDKLILKQLLLRNYRYLGMLGSVEKVKTLFAELEAEGFGRDGLQNVHAPIGLPIHSKTPEEIAVSILAEIIRVKNG